LITIELSSYYAWMLWHGVTSDRSSEPERHNESDIRIHLSNCWSAPKNLDWHRLFLHFSFSFCFLPFSFILLSSFSLLFPLKSLFSFYSLMSVQLKTLCTEGHGFEINVALQGLSITPPPNTVTTYCIEKITGIIVVRARHEDVGFHYLHYYLHTFTVTQAGRGQNGQRPWIDA
jgi:hypothetical protein